MTEPVPAPINWKKNLLFVWISQFLAMAGFGCCMPFIPLLLKDNLHVIDDHVRGLYVSFYYLAGMASLAVATTVWGILADRFGRKIMLLRASYAAALFYPLLAFAPNYWVLILIRFITSFFAGTVNPAQTLLVTTCPREKHGFVLGTLSTAIWSGNMTGYLCGGLVVHYFNYTTAFLLCGAIYLTSGLLIQFFAEEHFVRPVKTAEKVRDNKQKTRGILTPGIFWLLVLFLTMGIARRIDQPFVAMLVEMVHGAKEAAFFTGIVSAAAALGGVLSGVVIGHLCDRFSPVKIMIPVLAFSVAGTLLQAYSFNIWMLIAARFFTYFAAGGTQPVLQVLLTRIIKPENRGTYFGWTGSMNTAGGIFASLIAGGIAWFGNVREIFVAGAILLALMIPLMIPAGRACRKEYIRTE